MSRQRTFFWLNLPSRERLGRGLWVASLIATVASPLLALGLITYGRSRQEGSGHWWSFSGDPASAQEVRGTIARRFPAPVAPTT